MYVAEYYILWKFFFVRKLAFLVLVLYRCCGINKITEVTFPTGGPEKSTKVD